MTLVGNPQEYIMIYGGSTYENITAQGANTVIKKTLSDVWSFFIKTTTWTQIFPNSVNNPGPSEFSTLVTVRPDRLVLLYGG